MAISLDTVTTKDAGNVSSTTLSHTCTGASMLVVCVGADSGASPTGVTYNGVSMTKEATQTGIDTTIWTLANPTAGANNISVTFAASHYFGIVGISLIGTETTSYTDGTPATGTGSTNNAQLSVTTVSANSWLVMAGSHNRNSSRTAISGSTIQGDQFITTDNFRVLGITAPTTTAGSYNIGWTMGTASDGWYAVAIGIKEAATSPIKTWNGVAKASIKTFNGLA